MTQLLKGTGLHRSFRLPRTSLFAPDEIGIWAKGAVPIDVDLISESVAFDPLRQALPLRGEAYAGDWPLPDQLSHVLGRVGDG